MPAEQRPKPPDRPGGEPSETPPLEEHVARHPEDHVARLRLVDQLVALGEAAAARELLAPLESDRHPAYADALARLAALDEREGRAPAAAARWERLLADDIENDLAWAHLHRLRPAAEASDPAPAATGVAAAAPTLDSAAGVNVSRFQIVRELGRGASATVYLARDPALDLDLALKVLHPRGGGGAADQDHRFFTEARTVAGLRHPGVVAIYDVDEAARTLVMEYVGGGTLRERLRARTRGTAGPGAGLSVEETGALARGLLAALGYVHQRGVVHGDLTPRNLLLREAGPLAPAAELRPVLVDFGIARLREAAPGASEQPAGTPLYLAPEQFRGEPSSERTDLFAAGALLWEALVGRPMRAHADLVSERPVGRPLPPEIAEAHAGLARLVAALTATDPAARPASAGDALGLLA
jgi:hypothetical protein